MMPKAKLSLALEKIDEKTPRKIIEATLEEIGVNGLSVVTTKRISQRAKTSTGIIHHYFETKDNLVYAAYIYLIRELSRQTQHTITPDLSLEERLRTMICIQFSDTLLTETGGNVWPHFWAHSLHDPMVKRILRVYSGRVHSNMAYIFRELGLPRAEARRAAHRLFSTVHGVWLEHQITGMLNDRDYAVSLVEEQLNNILSKIPR